MLHEVDVLCKKYDAYVGPSSRMRRRVKRMNYDIWSKGDQDIFNSIPVEEIKCVEIHMPEDRFRALLEHADWVQNAGLQGNNYFANNVSRVSHMIVEHERECRIRQENPTVKAAYEKYQTLAQYFAKTC